MKFWIELFVFSPKLWVGSVISNDSTIKTSQIEVPKTEAKNTLFSSRENLKKQGGQIFFKQLPC